MSNSTIAVGDSTKQQQGISRRSFVAATAGSFVLMAKFSVGKAFGQEVTVASPSTTDAETFDTDLFVSIAPDGTVSILAHRSEMGTGIRTCLPRVVADEMEADWDRVKIVQAIGDKRLGSQNTDGSNSVQGFFDRMRIAGVTARTMLEQAAAKKWDVEPTACRAENHQVVHANGDQKIGFGELVEIARTLDVPDADSLKMKSREQWRYIGKDVPITDLNDILTGKAVYGIDARMENQVFAVIARPPVLGGRVKSFDATETKAMAGVIDVVEIPPFKGAPKFQPLGGVAVIANSTWAAWQGRDWLTIEWDHGDHESYDSEEFANTLAETARQPGTVLRQHGDAIDIIEKASTVHSADYHIPHLAHASMETPCAVAEVKFDEGKITGCVVSAATQNPQAVQAAVGEALGLDPSQVIAKVTLLGSAFGRKGKPDYCVEAALLSRELKRPVHVTWTREDDLTNDYFHTVSQIHLRAAVDDAGRPTAWLQRAVYPPIKSIFDVSANQPGAGEAEMGLTDLPFDVPASQVEVGKAQAHTGIGWYRSVAHIQQNFAVSSFADELALHAGRDSLDYLLELLGDDRHVDLKAAGLNNRGASPEKFPMTLDA